MNIITSPLKTKLKINLRVKKSIRLLAYAQWITSRCCIGIATFHIFSVSSRSSMSVHVKSSCCDLSCSKWASVGISWSPLTTTAVFCPSCTTKRTDSAACPGKRRYHKCSSVSNAWVRGLRNCLPIKAEVAQHAVLICMTARAWPSRTRMSSFFDCKPSGLSSPSAPCAQQLH